MNNFTITSGAVVFDHQMRILLKKDPVRGWELPGGIVEDRENIKNTVVREIKEETGIDMEIIAFCGTSQEINRNVCNMWWLGTAIDGKLQTSNESVEVGFFTIEQALQLITTNDFKEELLACLEKENHPFFITFK